MTEGGATGGTPHQGWATVKVKRLWAFAGYHAMNDVFVDGQPAATLGPGDECELKVWPGTHRIEVRVGRAAGFVDLALAAGQHVDLECRPASGPAMRRAIEVRQPPWSTQVFGTPPGAF